MEVNPGPSCGGWVGVEGRGTKHVVGTWDMLNCTWVTAQLNVCMHFVVASQVSAACDLWWFVWNLSKQCLASVLFVV